ncbi:DUF4395 domain-containing protein [Prolixibacteraceae bacterium Z1-6]|uniref:DUF4395 domain-containing protein n=1 Tax=Draconibacterium aestuarii TaxID=2998507 RepID=A0A9X3J8K3_9BACT|nr:DUF4395 domain-containing protein [Prolixibacteraceae bacterium Z1-6]
MEIISFGEYIDGHSFKVLDERRMRASAGIMLLLGAIASINGFILKNYFVVPWFAGFLLLNFIIGIFINPKFAPTVFVAWLFVRKQSLLPIGAVQKKFAWSLGLALSATIFVLSLYLQNDVSYFEPVCMLCIVCLILLYLETAFGICVGCKLYLLTLKLRILPQPKERPNCMGDSCGM